MVTTYNSETLVSVKVKEKEYDDRLVYVDKPKTWWDDGITGFIIPRTRWVYYTLEEIINSKCFAISDDKKLYTKDKVVLRFINNETQIIYFDNIEDANLYANVIIAECFKHKLTFEDHE